MAKPHPLPPRPPQRLPPKKQARKRPLQKGKTKRRKREKKPLPPLLPRRVPHKFRNRARKKRLALRRSSVRSPANTASVFPRFPAQDLAVAFRSKTSCLSSSASRRRQAPPQLLLPSRQSLRQLHLGQPHR